MSARLNTRIWHESPSTTDPYVAEVARCHGYDVYGELLGRISWPQMLLLMIKGQAPSREHCTLLDDMMVAFSNPGPRHPAVHAAMAGAVGGSPAAACLSAALAVGAGRAGGAREVYEAVAAWHACAGNFAELPVRMAERSTDETDIWPAHHRWPGFGPHNEFTPLPVRQTLLRLVKHTRDGALHYLHGHEALLVLLAGKGLNPCGVAAAACVDLGLDAAQAEMLYLLLSLPGAAVHALEQADTSYRDFPYGEIEVLNDPDRAS